MKPVVVVGGGGHAKVIIEILQEGGIYEVVGCTVSGSGPAMVLDVPVLGDDTQLGRIFASGVRHAFIAVGENLLRRKLAQIARTMGFELANAVSPHAVLSRRSTLGGGVAVMAGALINPCVRLGDGCIINTGATVDHDCVIGAWSHIAPGVNLAGCVTIGEGAFLGVGSRAIPKVSVGEWTIVGAGAVVVRNLPARVTAIGVPARILAGC